MKTYLKKIKGIVYNKTTFMLIPHSEKGIYSFHLSHLGLLIFSLVILTF